MFSDEELARLANRGLFVGPKETEEDFFARIQSLQQGTSCNLTDLYGIAPDYLIIDSDAKVSFLHGAHTEIEGNSVKIAIKESVLVTREEALRHEAVHAVRSQFEEPLFEETFAYATSKWAYRRVLGPLLTVTHLMLFAVFWGLSFLKPHFFFPSLFGGWVGVISTGYLRLPLALRKIRKLVPNVDPMHFALHLTDKELKNFKKTNLDDPSLRWRQIRARFSLTTP